jgi:hypothetical protein
MDTDAPGHQCIRPDVNSVKVMLATFDKNNLMHRIIIVVTNMLQNVLKINEKVNMYKSVFVVIEYEGRVVFTGCVNFSGID